MASETNIYVNPIVLTGSHSWNIINNAIRTCPTRRDDGRHSLSIININFKAILVFLCTCNVFISIS